LNDSAGHSYFVTIPNSTLASLGSYGLITVNKASFAEDVDNTSRTAGAISWSTIASYNFSYPTTGTTVNYQYIDSIYAGTVNWGGVTPVTPTATGEVVITSITPSSAPAGAKFTAIGTGFGASQGLSVLVFENSSSNVTYPITVTSWSDTSIEALVPTSALVGSYTLNVVKVAITAGLPQAFMSNSAGFQVTAVMSTAGIATVYPNPFNPLATTPTIHGVIPNQAIIIYNPGGATNLGVYIYDSTARLIYRASTSASQITWNGRDDQNAIVADGVYLLRIVNEENKAVVAKAKNLVIKK
jgi:hypothetical protein